MNKGLYRQLQSIPVVKYNNFERETTIDEGYKIFDSKNYPELSTLKINKVGVEILELCNGNRTLEDIILCMKNKYQNIDKLVLEKDLLEFLSNMWKFGLIEWKNEHPFKNFYEQELGTFKFKMLTSDETIRLLDKMEVDINYPSLLNQKFAKDRKQIRNRILFGQEVFFTIESDQIDSLISLFFTLERNKKSITIHPYYLNVDAFDIPQISEFINWSIDKYSDLLNIEFTRVDVNFFNYETKNKAIFKELGFNYSGTKKDFITYKEKLIDIDMYSKSLL